MNGKPLWMDLTRDDARDQFEQHLVKSYPLLFPILSLPKEQLGNGWMPISGFGIECGPGWWPILDEACQQIEAINRKIAETNPDSVIIAHQIKEKFGGLRFYTNFCNDEVDAIIRLAEEQCSKTCESCGALGKLYTTGYWLSTDCEKCKRDGAIDYETFVNQPEEPEKS